MAVVERPFPPGTYGVVVVGSGPGGLQAAYELQRLGVDHAVLSADDAPGGMFRTLPIFERLISWTKPEAPQAYGSREYELYDHNSLVAEEEHSQASVPSLMDRSYDVPSRAEMEAALARFSERAGLRVRYGCRWEATRRDDEGFVVETTDGEYRCRAVVFAVGVTTPWTAPIPGLEHAAHYVDVREAADYDGRSVFIVGKRNSAFEIANNLLPWARRIVLASPRAIRTDVLGHSPLRTRYLQPLDEHVRGGFGTSIVDASIERVERTADGFRVHALGTSWDGPLVFDCDDVIAATGFRTPLRDLPELGVATVADGRIPAQTAFWESVSVPGIYFAGNATLGSPGLRKQGLSSNSGSVNGFRYNARILVRHWRRSTSASTRRVRSSSPTGSSRSCCASSRPRPSSGSRRATSAGSSTAPTTACATTGSCRSRSSSTSPAPTPARSRSRWRRTGRSTRPSTCACGTTSPSTRCRRIRSTTTRLRSIAARSRSSSSRC